MGFGEASHKSSTEPILSDNIKRCSYFLINHVSFSKVTEWYTKVFVCLAAEVSVKVFVCLAAEVPLGCIHMYSILMSVSMLINSIFQRTVGIFVEKRPPPSLLLWLALQRGIPARTRLRPWVEQKIWGKKIEFEYTHAGALSHCLAVIEYQGGHSSHVYL